MDDGWEMVPINDSSDVMDEYVVSERRLFNFKTGKMIWISNAPMMNKELKFGKKEAPHPPSPPFRWRPEVLERIRRLIVDQSLWGVSVYFVFGSRSETNGGRIGTLVPIRTLDSQTKIPLSR
tara:strand:+ start:165 stop:530 length:366 start_codon:yes stop_codon:yes gene_type:complete